MEELPIVNKYKKFVCGVTRSLGIMLCARRVLRTSRLRMGNM